MGPRTTLSARRTVLLLAAMLVCGGLFASLRGQPAAVGPATQAGLAVEPREPPPPPTVTRVYDIRDLLVSVPDFDQAPDLLLQGQLRGGGGLSGVTAVGETRNICFPRATTFPEVRPSREELVEDITRLIQEIIVPDTWRDTGGTIGAIKELSGQLIITQTEENHRAVRDLLGQLREQSHGNLRVRGHWVLIDRADLEPVLKPIAKARPPATGPAGAAGSAVFSRPPAPGVSSLLGIGAADLAGLRNVRAVYRAEMSGLNSQRVAAVAVKGHTPSGVVSAVATPASAEVEANAGATFDGLVLDVTPTLTEDRRRAVVTIRGQWRDSKPEAGGDVMATVRATTTTRPAVDASAGGGSTEASSAAPRRSARVSDLRTTLSIPVGQWVLVGGATLEATPAAEGANASHQPPQLYLFIEVTAD